MAIHLDVYADLNDRSVRTAADRMHDNLERAGQRSGRAFGEQFGRGLERGAPSAAKLEKATDRVADALGRVNVEQAKFNKLSKDADDATKIAQVERLATAQRRHASAVREAVRAQLDMGESSRKLNADATTLNQTLSLLGKSATSFGWAAAVPTLTVAAGAAVAAAGALALLPAAAGAAGAAFGTLKLATLGFGDAMDSIRDPEKFAEALQSLSPNAQQAALSIRQLMPAFDGLKSATQDALFEGVAGQLQRLSGSLLPTIQTMTTGVARAFNQMFMGVTDQLMTPETSAAINNITANITAAFQNLAPAAAPLTKAFADIMSVGSDFLPQLASAATNAANAFSKFITQARDSGQLKQWIADGVDILRQIGTIVWDVGRAFIALAPVAKDVLPYISGAVREVADVLRDHPGLIWGVVGAFAAWKTIEGVVALTSSLSAISTLLRVTLPAAAATGAAGITAALGPALAAITAATAVVAVGVGSQQAADLGHKPVLEGRFPHLANPPAPPAPPAHVPSGGTGLFGPVIAGAPSVPAAPPISRGALDGVHGTDGTTTAPGPAPWTPLPVPLPTGNPGGPKLPDAPVLPYDTTLPEGFGNLPQTSEIVGAENAVMDARHTLAEKRARVNQLEKDGNATQDDIQKARNDVINAQQQQQQAELRLQDAAKNLYDKQTKQAAGYASQMGDIGAQLDSDFGISKGLSGIAENLTKFIANLAFAPALGALSAVSAASPSKGGYGLMGVLGAQGAFGERFTGIDYSAQQQGYSYAASAMGPAPVGRAYGGYDQSAMGTSSVGGGRATGGLASSLYQDASGRWHSSNAAWEHLIQRESSGINQRQGIIDVNSGGNEAEGLFQITPQTWRGHGGAQYAPSAISASPQQQAAIAEAIFRGNPSGSDWGAGISGRESAAALQAGLGPMRSGAPQGFGGGVGTGAGFPYGSPPLAGAPAFGVPQPQPAFAPNTPIGAAVAPPSGTGNGIGITPGGTLDTAITAAASMFPGAGQAAQTGIKLASRAIQYGGQAAGIGVQGLMETFLPTGGSELANNNWLTRIVGGLAGAAPALPNVAGKGSQPKPEDVAGDPNTAQQGQGGQGSGNTYNVQIDAANREPQGIAKDFVFHTQGMNEAPGMH